MPQEELEDHLKKTYSDSCRPAPPGVAYDMFNLKVKEVREFARKARSMSAPVMNGLPYKLCKNCPIVLGELTVLLQWAWKEDLIPQDWCLVDGIQILKRRTQLSLATFA